MQYGGEEMPESLSDRQPDEWIQVFLAESLRTEALQHPELRPRDVLPRVTYRPVEIDDDVVVRHSLRFPLLESFLGEEEPDDCLRVLVFPADSAFNRLAERNLLSIIDDGRMIGTDEVDCAVGDTGAQRGTVAPVEKASPVSARRCSYARSPRRSTRRSRASSSRPT